MIFVNLDWLFLPEIFVFINYLILMGCLAFAGWQEDVQEIDRQIKELTVQKNRLKADAAQREDEANRWQFEPDEEDDARRAFQKADSDHAQILDIEMQIHVLEQEKEAILEKHQPKSS